MHGQKQYTGTATECHYGFCYRLRTAWIYDRTSYHTRFYYLPCGIFAKNHFIKEESMTTEKYLSYFFPFDKIDFMKKGMESSWSTDDVQMMFSFMLNR